MEIKTIKFATCWTLKEMTVCLAGPVLIITDTHIYLFLCMPKMAQNETK